MKPTYEERVAMIEKAIMGQQPERVPIVCKQEPSFAVEYAGYDLKTALWNPKMIVDATDKMYTDIYSDAGGNMPRFPLIYRVNGSQAFVPRELDDLVQHPEVEGLHADEYDEYISDPFKCIMEKVVPRLYPKLAMDSPQGALNALRAMIADKQAKSEYLGGCAAVEKNTALLTFAVALSKLPSTLLPTCCAVLPEFPWTYAERPIR